MDGCKFARAFFGLSKKLTSSVDSEWETCRYTKQLAARNLSTVQKSITLELIQRVSSVGALAANLSIYLCCFLSLQHLCFTHQTEVLVFSVVNDCYILVELVEIHIEEY